MDLNDDVDGNTSVSSGSLYPARKVLIGTATSTWGPRARNPALARLQMISMRNIMSGIVLSKLLGKVGQTGWSIFLGDWEIGSEQPSGSRPLSRNARPLGSQCIAAICVAHCCSVRTFLPSWKGLEQHGVGLCVGEQQVVKFA